MKLIFIISVIVFAANDCLGQVTKLKQQLEDLNTLTLKYIESHQNELQDQNVDEILAQLINGNSTGLLSKYPPTCPLYDGIYQIEVPGHPPFPVLCNSSLAGAGWTVIAQRFDGNINFYRDWSSYKQGFGELDGEFFIGLDKLYAMLNSQQHELYVYLEDFEGNSRYAKYDHFIIGNESKSYSLENLGLYSGNAGDSLTYHLHRKFSTYDKDHTTTNPKCSIERVGAWWYYSCLTSNLFGMYLKGQYSNEFNRRGMCWTYWRGYDYSYKTMQMMIRPKCFCS